MVFCKSRRAFLKKSLLASALVLCGQPAWGKPSGHQPAGNLLRLYHTHTAERLTVSLRDPVATDNQEALASLDWFLRCHFNNKVHPIDPRVLEYLTLLDQTVGGGREIHIISGYRSPEYNAYLRRGSGGVAKQSLHLEGRALDIRIPAVPLATLRQAAMSLRYGGVGYYPASDFLHLDSGSFRQW